MIAADLNDRIVRRRGVGAVVLALAAVGALALAPAAGAKTEPVGGGSTKLKLTSKAADYLDENKSKVKAVDPASSKKSGFNLPIKKGELDTKKVKGQLKHDGALELKGPGGKVELTKFQAKFSKSSKLSAKAPKKNTKLFDLDTENAKTKTKGTTTKINKVTGTLTSKGVAVFEDITEMELSDPEMTFIKVKVAAEPGDLPLDSGDTSLTPDSSLGSKLSAAGITLGPSSPATQKGDVVSFPVKSGDVGAGGGSGTVRLDGGIKLTRGGTTLDLTKPRINLAEGEITMVIGGERVVVLEFDADAAKVKVDGKKVTVTKIDATLSGDGAKAINDAFGGSTFAAGDKFGKLEISGKTG